MAATPQTPTFGTESSTCSAACVVSEALRWWQSLYKLSAKKKKSKLFCYYPAMIFSCLYSFPLSITSSPPCICNPSSAYFLAYPSLFIFILLNSSNLFSPHSFPNCSPPSFCLLAPERWWWWEPRRCWRRRRGRPRSTPRKRWTSPSGTPGWGPGSHRSHRLNASAPCKEINGNKGGLEVVWELHMCCMCMSRYTHCGHPSPVDTVKRVRRAQATLS